MDGNQNPISYEVNGWGRITGVGFADGVKESYEYTPAGQISKATDGNGNSVQYYYNSLGKVSERTDQLGYTETFRYDEEGNLTLHIDRDGRQQQRACNVFGKPVYEKATDAEEKHTNISTWHYDSLGRIVRAVCDGHSYEYVYDAQGNLKEKRSSGKRLVSYTYDKAGQITEIQDPAGTVTKYEYDILGRRSRIYNGDGLEVCYGYDALNRISHIHYGNGVETAYTYDGDGNIRTLETKAGENMLLFFAYQYDGNGNRTAKVGTQTSVAMGGITAGSNALDISYSYDVRGQLLEERRNGASVCYTYDKAGNRIRKTDAQGEVRYFYNKKNQLLTKERNDEKKQFAYDRQGGIIEEKGSNGIRLFSYNSRHQQTKVETENGHVQENRYDAEGLRFELLENGRRTRFVYHNGELLHEEGREENQTSYHLGLGIDAFQRGQELSYYHRDEQLSTAIITGQRGAIKNSYQYDAFGAEVEATEQLSNRIRYTGQQYDELTEQYYLRARYYNPVLGRFMQEDTYWGDGLDLYAYCKNNPVIYCDPSGYELKDYLDMLEVYGDDSVEYWSQGFFSTYQERLGCTPLGQYRDSGEIIGYWEGLRGESLYEALDHGDRAIRANEVLQQYGQRGITYNNAVPNFRPVSETVVSIENMTGERYTIGGNFDQADEAFARYLNEHPDSVWFDKLGVDGEVTGQDISSYRKSNNLTWHEENDMVHVDLVSKDVNGEYGHLGGTSESKKKQNDQEYVQDTNCKSK